jgi:hypothetical protein
MDAIALFSLKNSVDRTPPIVYCVSKVNNFSFAQSKPRETVGRRVARLQPKAMPVEPPKIILGGFFYFATDYL